MRVDILTLFPDMFQGPFDESIIKRAQDRGLAEIHIHHLRNWAKGKHQIVDDRPFGGGVGMLLKIEPIYQALKVLKTKNRVKRTKVILMDAGGTKFTQAKARKLAKIDHLIIIAGHYEGVDHRVREHLIDEEISIGDYVLTGGELPAMVVIDSVVRLIKGVLEKPEAIQHESFSQLEIGKLLTDSKGVGKLETTVEYPQYTRPADFKGWKVPEVLLSGDHKNIEQWRAEQARKRTNLREQI